MFIVTGGVFTDTNFTEIVEGTQEVYGPFDTYEQAVSVWRGRMGWNVDTCEHRLFIKRHTPPEIAALGFVLG